VELKWLQQQERIRFFGWKLCKSLEDINQQIEASAVEAGEAVHLIRTNFAACAATILQSYDSFLAVENQPKKEPLPEGGGVGDEKKEEKKEEKELIPYPTVDGLIRRLEQVSVYQHELHSRSTWFHVVPHRQTFEQPWPCSVRELCDAASWQS